MSNHQQNNISPAMALWAATRWDTGLRTNTPKNMTPEQEKALQVEMEKRKAEQLRNRK